MLLSKFSPLAENVCPALNPLLFLVFIVLFLIAFMSDTYVFLALLLHLFYVWMGNIYTAIEIVSPHFVICCSCRLIPFLSMYNNTVTLSGGGS